MRYINLAIYEKKDWEYFLSIIDDREDMHIEWDDWYKALQKAKISLISEGFSVREVRVDVRELMHYCSEHNIKNDGSVRSNFVALK